MVCERVREAVGGTIRQRMMERLATGWASARELSVLLHIGEKEVYDHLRHIEKSAARSGNVLVVQPSVCRDCGFVFAKRDRLTKPGSCPLCRGTFVEEPLFALEKRG
ncbi:MAG: transcriptional regulator [Thermodesulfobacteriota bacterium]